MIVERYNIILHRISEDDIEMVRDFRLRPHVTKQMLYQNYISEADQQDWFKAIDNINNYYFLIYVKDHPVGVVYGKNVDFNERTSEGGIFIGEQDYLRSIYPSLASIIMLDLTFYILNLKVTWATVRSDNVNQIRYNQMLGYKVIENKTDNSKTCMQLVQESYESSVLLLKKRLSNIYNLDNLSVSWDDIIFSNSDCSRQHWFRGLPSHMEEIVSSKLNIC